MRETDNAAFISMMTRQIYDWTFYRNRRRRRSRRRKRKRERIDISIWEVKVN